MANTTGKKFGGRKKGTPNKNTNEIKEAYQLLITGNLSNMENWLNEIAKNSPEKAFDLVLKMSDFIVPKLSRQELKNETKIVEMTPEERDKKIDYLLKKVKEAR